MTISFTGKNKKREVINDSILVLSKLLTEGQISDDVRTAINKKLEQLINEL